MNRLTSLQRAIVDCRRCPRLVRHCRDVAAAKRRQYRDWTYWGRPVPSFGDRGARLLLIGLAPAAHGGNRTGRIFTGDRSGDWLFEALHRYGFANQPQSSHRGDGLKLHDCYITAVIHCAPQDNKPNREEILNCRPFLLEELALLKNLRVIVALGQVAFDQYLRSVQGLDAPIKAPRPGFGHGKTFRLAHDMTLIASYHPSQQNTLTKRLTRPMFHRIFATARRLLKA